MRILVVEDEHKIASSIKRGLEQEGYAVDVAYDGEQGYDLASSESYDAIVLDLMLPKIDGLTICSKLREEEKHTPILILTSKGFLSDRVNGLNTGADDYLVKPFAFEELLARLRALLRRPKNGGLARLVYKDLELDSVNFEVKMSGKKINLSRKEFALLEYLMRNSGKIVSKDNIIDHVWSYDADILPNTVEVYIGYLRKKISGLIQTVRGFGYKLD